MGEAIKARAIVLKKVDYKDNDRVLTLFSLERGKLTATVRGVKKQNSRLRPASELFAFGDYVLAEAHGRYTVTGFDCIEPFHGLREDFELVSSGSLMLKLTDTAVPEGEPNAELFALLLKCLDRLRDGNIPTGFTVSVFLLRLCMAIGYSPELNECVECGESDSVFALSPALGGILCKKCLAGAVIGETAAKAEEYASGIVRRNTGEHFAVSGACLLFMRKIVSDDFEACYLYKPTEKQVKELYSAACAYTSYFFDEKIKIIDYINKYRLI